MDIEWKGILLILFSFQNRRTMLGAPLRLIASEEEARDIGCDQITSVLNA